MEYIYTVSIDRDVLGSIYKISQAYILLLSKIEEDKKNIRFSLKTEYTGGTVYKVVPDEPLRSLSTQEYIVNTEEEMIYDRNIYETMQPIPLECRYMAIPVIHDWQIIDYTPTNNYDKVFVHDGYARELRDAKYVIIPASDCDDLSDLLIEKVEGNVYTSFNGRYTIIDGLPTSRYLHTQLCPVFMGEKHDIPFTYTYTSIIAKYVSLNQRLQKYGSSRIRSMIQALQCISNRLVTESNQFEASMSYNDVVALMRSLK